MGKGSNGGVLAKGVYAVCVKTDKSRYVPSIVIAK
jgi:hypothetical protein